LSQFFVQDTGPNDRYTFNEASISSIGDESLDDKKFSGKIQDLLTVVVRPNERCLVSPANDNNTTN